MPKSQSSFSSSAQEQGSGRSIPSTNLSTPPTVAQFLCNKWFFTLVILLLGVAASAAFLALGIVETRDQPLHRFEHDAEELANALQSAGRDYEMFALWIHQGCILSSDRQTNISMEQDIEEYMGICSRNEFRNIYEHIASLGVNFQSAQLVPLVNHTERAELERQSKLYYEQEKPDLEYFGISDFEILSNGTKTLHRRSNQPFYWPIHHVEPVLSNERAVDLDIYAENAHMRRYIEKAVATLKPVMTDRKLLIQEKNQDSYGVILQHPGISASGPSSSARKTLAQIVIRVSDLLSKAAQGRLIRNSLNVYLFDSTNVTIDPEFLGAVYIHVIDGMDGSDTLNSLPETHFANISLPNSWFYSQVIKVADRYWTVAVTADTTRSSNEVYIILGGTVILLSSIVLAICFISHMGRVTKLNRIRSEAEAEQSRSARLQVAREQHMNEFLSHEVRNPLASAISALSFVAATVKDPSQCQIAEPGTQETLHYDLRVMDASLQFINELLRNLLDISRSASKQLKLDFTMVDILHDVLDPVATILHLRGSSSVEVQVDCSEGMAVQGDRMRLKQIILNLSSNATKFVDRGFIRIRAENVDGSVELSVEDSGPGIPLSKRGRLWFQFQESLDVLSQGTGIGLSVCKNLSELMGAEIWHDEDYDSGVDGCPGTRFVIRLNQPALNLEQSFRADRDEETATLLQNGNTMGISGEQSHDLPKLLSVLFTDDDAIIRKMFIRALKRMAPEWSIREASNGETALRMTDTTDYDLIFVDQYMASIEKQLLGTETVRAMRSKGVKSIICGLSANDIELQFMEAGANAFMFKPFPCEKDQLGCEIVRILSSTHPRTAVENESDQLVDS